LAESIDTAGESMRREERFLRSATLSEPLDSLKSASSTNILPKYEALGWESGVDCPDGPEKLADPVREYCPEVFREIPVRDIDLDV
jgi:hypothetical protein